MGELERLYEEEIQGAERYTEMAEKHPEYRQIFLDMAKEELLHSDHLKAIMKDAE